MAGAIALMASTGALAANPDPNQQVSLLLQNSFLYNNTALNMVGGLYAS